MCRLFYWKYDYIVTRQPVIAQSVETVIHHHVSIRRSKSYFCFLDRYLEEISHMSQKIRIFIDSARETCRSEICFYCKCSSGLSCHCSWSMVDDLVEDGQFLFQIVVLQRRHLLFEIRLEIREERTIQGRDFQRGILSFPRRTAML